MMQRKKMIMAALAVLLPFSGWAESYDLPSLERVALEQSRVVMAGRDRLFAARSGRVSAAAWPNPEVEYLSGRQQARGLGGASGDARSYALTQPLEVPWLRHPRIDAAEAQVRAAEADSQACTADYLARLRLRYFDLLRREAELNNAREDAQLMEGMRSRIAKRVEQGESARIELIKAEAEMLNAQKVAQVAGFRVAQARSQLRQLVGEALPADFSVSGSLRQLPTLPRNEQLKDDIQQANPELVRARAETLRAERQLALEKAQRWPRFALKAGVDEDPDVRTRRFGVVLNVPLWDRRVGPVAEAEAQLSRARNELAAHEFGLAQQLEVAFQQYEIAQAQVKALEGGIVRQAENALQVAVAAYRFGERGYIEVLDAQRVRRAARVELIAARHEVAAAWVEIERLRALPQENKP